MPVYITEDEGQRSGRNIIAESEEQAQEIVNELGLELKVIGRLVSEQPYNENKLKTKNDENQN